jgi:hypothetical protein
MQLLKIANRMFNGCSQVHKPENPFKELLLAYELANNQRFVIHKFISQRAKAKKLLQAYELMNNFALKKRIINLLLNKITSYFARALKTKLEHLRVTFLFCAN